jgi:thioredoxin 1
MLPYKISVMGKFQELLNSETPVLVDFFAEWCGPCKMMAPELKKLVGMHGDQLKVIKVDIDKNPQAASAYNVNSVPTLILFRKGLQLWRQSGALSAGQLSAIVKSKIQP